MFENNEGPYPMAILTVSDTDTRIEELNREIDDLQYRINSLLKIRDRIIEDMARDIKSSK